MADPAEAVALDVTKLSTISEEPQQQIYVLSFLSTLERLVERLDGDGASAYQLYVKKELVRVLNLSAPAPTRLIRNVAGRCFAGIFAKGDRKLLFDTINELLGTVNAGKGVDVKTRHAAVHCLGEIFGAAGDSAGSICVFACGSLLKLLKNASNHCGLRCSIFRALGKVFTMVGTMADENIARDVSKAARNAAAGDKSAVVQANAVQCLEELARHMPFFNNQQDYDKLLSTILKAFDSSSAAVRKAAASCLATALVQAYTTESPEIINKLHKRAKSNKKRNSMALDDEGDVMSRPGSPAPGKKEKPKLAFGLEDLLKQLSTHYVKTNTTARVRAGLAQCYVDIMMRLGTNVVESNYAIVANHLLVDVLAHPGIVINRFRQLTTRKYVRIILDEVIGQKLLGETGQLNAVRSLVNGIIKNYPQVLKDRPEPSKHTLTGALHALASLITTLGCAATSVLDIIRDGLLQVLQHPSYTVQITTSWCLRAFVTAVPVQLLPILTICMNNVSRELTQLTSRRPTTTEALRRCTGYANGLAAAISTAPLQPLYASVDVTSRILSLATSLLKSSGDYDLRISSTQIQVAWILIGGLMALGPNFVKIHLSQLLLLWKNALPKPLAKDTHTDRSQLELSFLAHVRECALGSILAFLEFNHRLLTADVSKRIASMLQNSTLFLNTLPSKKSTDDVAQRLSPSLQLLDFDLMVRRRVLQCYVKLVKLSHGEALQANLLTIAVSFFADPEKYTPSSLSTAIASSAGNFESLWEIGDNYAYGVCGLVRGYDVNAFDFEPKGSKKSVSHWMTRDSPEARIDETLHTPVQGSIEHDSVSLYLSAGSTWQEDPEPAPPATDVVNSAINLFTILLPMQPPKVQESILEQIVTFLSSNTLARDPGRKAAMTVNVAVALFGTVRLTMSDEIPSTNLATPSVLKIISEMLQVFVIMPDAYVRNVAYEAMGSLCSVGGNTFTGNMINWLVDTVVNNRDPNARAGSAVALGCIHSHVGGMAAGFHLKTVIGILMSLANDPHPTVHFWALEALARTIDSAGLTFSGYVTSTLGMLSQLYVAETHNPEVGSLMTSNLELDLPTQVIIARCVESLIGVLGPDLQDMAKVRELILTMDSQFLKEGDYSTQMEALRCLEHLAIFAASHIDMDSYVKRLQKELKSPYGELRDVAIDGLCQLMKGDAETILKTAEPGLEETLWLTLDENPGHAGIKNVFSNWMSQTAVAETAAWVDRCQSVMTKLVERNNGVLTNEEAKHAGTVVELGDEEVAGLSAATAASGEKDDKPSGQELLRWQVRTFAVQCLSELLTIAAGELNADPESPVEDRLVGKIGEIIKMAFSASTSNVVDLRLGGMKIIDQVLKMFGQTPDPDFAEATLLEQYQAQIASALTPAFAADSSPELASEAVNVCAGFIATGIVKDVDRMGRILKLLTSALENFANESENASIGDLKGLSSNAQVMVKMAVLRGWAELQVASKQQHYLIDVVKPHITTLVPMWLSSLKEFARLRFEPDISTASGSASLGGSIDTIYAALNRETLLRFYQDSWLKLVDAIASLIEQDSQFVFDALDGKSASESTNGEAKHDDINYRDEPVAFFFVLFGIAFEALVGRPGVDSLATKEETLEILLALKKILHPSVCGHAIYREDIFSETMDMLDRLVLTEGIPVQRAIVEIARNLCVAHPAARNNKNNSSEEGITEEIDQLFELTRLIVLVLAGALPNLVDIKNVVRNPLGEEAVELISASLDALVDAAEVFPAVIRMDLYASILHIFTTIFGTSVCQAEVVPRSLPIFKRFIRIISASPNEIVITQVRSTLQTILRVLSHARLKDPELAIPATKNGLMASTIVVTSGANMLPAADPLVPSYCDAVLDGLNTSDTTNIATQCIRSNLLSAPKGAADVEIVRALLPRLVTLAADPALPHAAAIGALLNAFLPSLDPPQREVAMALFVPMFLERARREEAVRKEVAQRLLELAGADGKAFADVVKAMQEPQRQFLGAVLKAGQGQAVKKEEREGPSIELKMEFGPA